MWSVHLEGFGFSLGISRSQPNEREYDRTDQSLHGVPGDPPIGVGLPYPRSNVRILHISSDFAQQNGSKCTVSAPCTCPKRGLGLYSRTLKSAEGRICTVFWANRTGNSRTWQGFWRFPQAEFPHLATGCTNYHQNTRCCGFRLTGTIDSAIFATAAVNGL